MSNRDITYLYIDTHRYYIYVDMQDVYLCIDTQDVYLYIDTHPLMNKEVRSYHDDITDDFVIVIVTIITQRTYHAVEQISQSILD